MDWAQVLSVVSEFGQVGFLLNKPTRSWECGVEMTEKETLYTWQIILHVIMNFAYGTFEALMSIAVKRSDKLT